MLRVHQQTLLLNRVVNKINDKTLTLGSKLLKLCRNKHLTLATYIYSGFS